MTTLINTAALYHGLMVPSTQMADGVNAVLFRERIDDAQLTLHP